jgi:uncharacterized protein (DUF58 family)
VKQGYEFAEIRPYQAGDSVRFINWRRYANTGQLYINRFQEERRPQCWLVMDRRNAMCFGTHVRLKVAQAALLAIYHLYKAHYHQMAIGGLILDRQSHWYEARSSSTAIQALQQHITAPCPPATQEVTEPQLDNVLRHLKIRCQPGCLIFIISDFHDLSAAANTTLAALSAEHTVSALHIIDRVEAALPTTGMLNLQEHSSGQIRHIDCDNEASRQQMNQRLQESLTKIKHLLTQHDMHYRCVHADSNLLTTEQLRHAR